MIGTNFGRYEIRSLLGTGGMGEVYRARDSKLGRDVAIKVLPAAFSADAERLRRFEQEAEAAGALNHPNILSIYDVETHDGAPYVVSELLEGETLREHLKGAPLSQRKAIDYALQITRGLAAAHQKGIVHRDLKPENLFVTKDGRIKILDFGLAKLTHRASEGEAQTDVPTIRINTDPGAVMGTAGYMSPEQARGLPADHRSDIFSFGVVLYEMLSGERPFRGESAVETLNAILKEDPPEFSTSNNISPALERIARRCLEKNPEERFQSARDLAFALEALSGLSSSSTPILALPTSSTPKRAQSRERLAWIMAGVLAVVALALAIASFRGSPAEARALRFSLPLPEGASYDMTAYSDNVVISPDGRRIAFVVSSDGRAQLWIRPLDELTAQPVAGTEGADSPFWSPDSRFIGFFAGGKLKKVEISSSASPQTICDISATIATGSWSSEGTILFADYGVGRKGIYRVSAGGGAVTQVTRVDDTRGEAYHLWPHFLPNGRNFLYLSRVLSTSEDRGHVIYVGSLDSAETRPLTSVDAPLIYSRMAYAPPGYLLYVREGTLLAQPFDAEGLRFTGEPFPIVERVDHYYPTGRASFSASNTGMLVYRPTAEAKRRLAWFDRTGREIRPLGAPGNYESLRIAPDGSRVAVEVNDARTGAEDIYIYELGRDAVAQFTFEPGAQWGPLWSPDGRQIVFTTDRFSTPDLHIKPTNGGAEDEPILQLEGLQFPNDWSADGRFILYHDTAPRTKSDIWALPMFGERTPRPLIRTPFNEWGGRFSPDGRWVAFISDEPGREEIYVQSFAGSGERLRISTSGGSGPRWRRDGRELFYLAPDGRLMAVAVRTNGESFDFGAPTPLFTVASGVQFAFYDVAADGQTFLFNMPSPSARPEPINAIVNWTAQSRR